MEALASGYSELTVRESRNFNAIFTVF